MIRAVTRLLPHGLAGRIILLLISTIIIANLIALLVLGFQQQRFDKHASEDRQIERIVALIPAMQAVDDQVRQIIAKDATSRFARVQVEGTPLLEQTATDSRSEYIAQVLTDTLGLEDVRVAIVERVTSKGPPKPKGHNVSKKVIAVTTPLTARNGQQEWLNIVTSAAAPRKDRFDAKPFFTVLGLSLLCVLGVSIMLAGQLTKPLAQLSQAAEAAGRGDRTARVPEGGPREMRKAAQAFNAMQAEISQFDAERVRMLAAVGHDLRTPMTSLRIRAEMLDDDSQREAMVRTLDEMTVMADGLVTYAKEGQEGEKMIPLVLGPQLTQICADRGVPCDAELDALVRGRRVGLGRAFGNLIDNALRYGGKAAVTLRTDGQNAIVTIKDDGPGIPPDQLDAMFQPFTRGDHSRSLETGGAGLGLAIARTIILAHGGKITLENLPEGGLQARVSLPLEKC